jgi:hypothetical protein
MMQRLDFEVPAPSQELTGASLEVAREALARFVEAARQAHNLLNQSADVMACGAEELHERAVQHAGEHLQLSFRLAHRLLEAKGLEEALDFLNLFSRHTVDTCARQIQELSQFITRFAPKAVPEEGAK